MLLNDTMMLPTPNRAFVIGRVDAKSTSGESKEKDCSVNNMTISVVEGRYGTLKSDPIHIQYPVSYEPSTESVEAPIASRLTIQGRSGPERCDALGEPIE
ncbi:G-type lectin S-receptor-like serine/threonine-protein kinase, partial [Tanacetum coccineum]